MLFTILVLLWRRTTLRSNRMQILAVLLDLVGLYYVISNMNMGGQNRGGLTNRLALPTHISLIHHTEKRLDSDLHQKSNSIGCILPALDKDNPEMKQFFKEYKPVTCPTFDWVNTTAGRFVIRQEAQRRFGPVQCTAAKLVRKSEQLTKREAYDQLIKDGSVINDDFLNVHCKGKDGTKYSTNLAAIPKKPKVAQRRQQYEDQKRKGNAGNSLDLNVIMIGQDSLSRLAWLRHLPLTRDYLVNTLGAIEMEGHGILGDGTPAALFPMLTGKREEELPEARRGHTDSKPVDNFPWIWKNFSAAGYVTAYLEDMPGIGTFTYRLHGFTEPPVDHYYRPFAVYAEKEYFHGCNGGKPAIEVETDYLRDLHRVYDDEGQRKFSFAFRSGNSHDNNNAVMKVDVYFREHIKDLYESGILEKSVLIVFADHGSRFSKVRKYAQGKIEERMPYFTIRMPKKFEHSHPEVMANLRHNSKRLTTPFDVHETLLELLHFTGAGVASISKRGVSLFKKIPDSRTCADADTDHHWCYCLNWTPIPTSDKPFTTFLSNEVVSAINRLLAPEAELCHQLKLSEVTNAMQLKVKDEMLKFKDTSDGGRGRFGIMTDTTKHSKITYQVSFMTSPGDGLFEASINGYLNNNGTYRYETDMNFISRINKYGSDPWCITKRIPELRKYCVCKQQTMTNDLLR